VGKSKGKRGRSANNVTIGGVLGSVAWAHELVLGGRPWDDTSQVSTNGVKTERFKSLVFLDNKVADINKNNRI
jgi:hypothetical protein